jgi:hypothetical protein
MKAGSLKGTQRKGAFRRKTRNASGLPPRGDFFIEEVIAMRSLVVRWKRFSLQVPGEVTLFLLVKIIAVLLWLHF